ncbi:MAG: DUF4920 domain-containing protein [Blastocatellia bacterium]|nr:DUF4920 domain-containing protein [Blastocatellia bacterium]
MKKWINFFILTLILNFAVISNVSADKTRARKHSKVAAESKATETIKRGEEIGNSPKVTLTKLMANPNDYSGKKVVVEGTIEKVCSKKGCWMELTEAKGRPGVRVTFKNYGFFVPTDSSGMKAKAEGEVTLKVLSKADADHLAGEGARLNRNADGTANEISFVASGVELRK